MEVLISTFFFTPLFLLPQNLDSGIMVAQDIFFAREGAEFGPLVEEDDEVWLMNKDLDRYEQRGLEIRELELVT